jgi:hypothetical protein
MVQVLPETRVMCDDTDFEPVFLLGGQSNMAGRRDGQYLPFGHPCWVDTGTTSPSTNTAQKKRPLTLCWDIDCNFGVENGSHSSGEWRPLQCQYSPGLQRHLFGPEMGLVESLCRRVDEKEDGVTTTSSPPLHFLKFAMGSTNLHSNWNPNNTKDDHAKPNQRAYFRRFIQFCQSALAEDTMSDDGAAHAVLPRKKKLVGMFWLQGEGDSTKAKEANSYLTHLQSFLDAVRCELNVPNLPIVVSPIVWKGKYAHVVNQALKDAGSGAVTNCICIDPLDASKVGVQQSGEPSCVATDHLTADAILDIGRRMGESIPLDQIW